MNKNHKLLKEFTDYCIAHPEQRFWQALRNWSGFTFILGSTAFDIEELSEPNGTFDTFYFEHKDK